MLRLMSEVLLQTNKIHILQAGLMVLRADLWCLGGAHEPKLHFTNCGIFDNLPAEQKRGKIKALVKPGSG